MRYVVAFAAAFSLSAPAQGAPAAPDKAALAKELAQFKAAQRLYDKRDFKAALAQFREIESPNAHLYAGRCLRELGNLPEAYEEFTRAIRDATEHADAKPHYAITRDAASTERSPRSPRRLAS
jgi:tetratricopeptide (TPR) repeat protein